MVKCQTCGNEYNNARLKTCPLCAANNLSSQQGYNRKQKSERPPRFSEASMERSIDILTSDFVYSEPQEVDNTFAWMLGVAPLLYFVFDFWLLNSFGVTLPLFLDLGLAFSVNSLLIKLDEKRLSDSGFELSAWWGGILVPAYLWKRNQYVGAGQGTLVTWIAAIMISMSLPVGAVQVGDMNQQQTNGHNEQRCTKVYVPNPYYDSQAPISERIGVSPGTWENQCRWYWVPDQ